MLEEGKLKPTDPVQQYLPVSVKMPTRNGKEITLLTLANHTSGLPRQPTNMPFADRSDPYADYIVAMMYDFLNIFGNRLFHKYDGCIF
jgi:serine-type D-Ala-D-Ala carboxypeptidase/endopeptidase